MKTCKSRQSREASISKKGGASKYNIEESKGRSRAILRPSLLALAVSQVLASPVSLAATIDVSGGCSLNDAILSANTDSNAHNAQCTAGDGPDVIQLSPNSTITIAQAFNNGTSGSPNLVTATPFVRTPIVIEGNGAKIERSRASNTPEFRLFTVFPNTDGSQVGQLTLRNVDIRNGNMAANGGAIYVLGELTLENTTITDNTSTNPALNQGGGAIFLRGSENSFTTINSTATLYNSTISGNSAVSGGGGIVAQTDATVTLRNSTVTGNLSFTRGGGIYASGGIANFYNSIVAGNATGERGDTKNGAEVFFSASASSYSNGRNLFGDSSHTNAEAFVSFAPGASDINATSDNEDVPIAQIRSSLNNNGGLTPTHSLPVGSPAIDGGMDCEESDQRGVSRDINQCDIGSFERLGTPGNLVVNVTSDNELGCSLGEAISAINLGASLGGCELMDDPQGLVIDPQLASSTITLSNELPVIKRDLNIDGSPVGGLTIDANYNGSVLRIDEVVVNLNQLTLTGGSASGGPGGGLAVTGGASVNITNSTITGNSTTTKGGGIYVEDSSVFLTDTTISDNSAFRGGGVSAVGSTVTSLRSRILENLADAEGRVAGGGVEVELSTLTLTKSTISGNSSTRLGGGIYVYRGSVSLSEATISDNKAVRGGGIYTRSSVVNLNNGTLSGNSASENGGGIYAIQSSTVTLSNSTMSENSASTYGGVTYGGGIYSYSSTLNLRNSIIANSLSGVDCVDGSSTPLVSANANNIIEDGSCYTDALSIDPKLGPLRNNGGPTQTHGLLEGSLAIDAGDNAVCAAAPINNRDQRGETRPFGAACDIGAVEFSGRDQESLFVVPLPDGKSVIFGL